MKAALLDRSGLREKAPRQLVLAQLTSTIGDLMVLTALPFAVFAVGGGLGQLGLALGVQSLIVVVLVLFGGVVGDRFNRRAIVIASDLLRFGSQGCLAILLVLDVASFWQILAAQAVHGAGFAFFQPALDGLVPQVVPAPKLRETNALRQMAGSLGVVLGPALAGGLISVSGPGMAFAADAMSFLISALLLRGLPRVAIRPASSSLLRDLAEGWSEFRERTWLWVIVAEFALLNTLVFAPFLLVGAQVADESLGGPGAWATILIAMGIGEIAGGIVAKTWQPSRPLVAGTTALIAWIVPLLLLADLAPVGLIAGGAALAGGAHSLFGTLWETTLQSHIPHDSRSRVASYDQLGSLAFLPVGYMIAGVAQAELGTSPTLMVGVGLILVATLVVAGVPSVRRLKPAPA